MDPEKLKAALAVGVAMRKQQKEYFKTRTRDDLARSKVLEREFDKAAEEAMREPNLFDGGKA